MGCGKDGQDTQWEILGGLRERHEDRGEEPG